MSLHMDPRRLPTAVFVLVTVLLLAVGGLWWRAAAPRPASGPVASAGEQDEGPLITEVRRLLPDAFPVTHEMQELVGAEPAVMRDGDVHRDPVPMRSGVLELRIACVGRAGDLQMDLSSSSDAQLSSNRTVHCNPDVVAVPILLPPVGSAEGEAEVKLAFHGDEPVIVAWQLIRSEMPMPAGLLQMRGLLPDSPDAVDTVEELVEPGMPFTRVVNLPSGAYQLHMLCLGGTTLQLVVAEPAAGQAVELSCDGRIVQVEVVVPESNRMEVTWTAGRLPSRLRGQFIPEPLGA